MLLEQPHTRLLGGVRATRRSCLLQGRSAGRPPTLRFRPYSPRTGAPAAAASGPSGSGSPAPSVSPTSQTVSDHGPSVGAPHSAAAAGVGSSSSSGSSNVTSSAGGASCVSSNRRQVRGTVLRTIDPVVAAASAARVLAAAPSAAAESSSAATQGDHRGTYDSSSSSADSSMDEGGGGVGGGIRLLVVVGVVLVDDPQWAPTAETAPMTAGAAAGPSAGAAPVNASRPVRVLLAQRPVGKANAGLWEFPGGKVDPGETPEAALVRELQEELGIGVEVPDLQPLTFASHTYPTFHLLMPLYVCRRWRGEPRGAEGQAVAWATAAEVSSYNLTPADVPLVPAVLAAMRHNGES